MGILISKIISLNLGFDTLRDLIISLYGMDKNRVEIPMTILDEDYGYQYGENIL